MKKLVVCLRLPVTFYLELVEEFRLKSRLDVYTKSRYGLHHSNPAQILCDIQVQIVFSETAHITFNGAYFMYTLYINIKYEITIRVFLIYSIFTDQIILDLLKCFCRRMTIFTERPSIKKITVRIHIMWARGSVVVKALCCKPEVRGFKFR
jgi:hypothetical protein